MKLIENLSGKAFQVTHIVIDDGSVIDISLTYRPAIERWQIDIAHPRLNLMGKILCNHPNLIRQFRHTAGFGLACILNDGTEPNRIDDFVSGRAEIYVLSDAEIQGIETDVFGMTGVIV